MASQQPDEQKGEPYGLHPDDVSELDFPVAMRGFDREAVKRKLKRVADAYGTALRQRERSRVMAEEAHERAVAAEAEIQASARNISNLTKRGSQLESELAEAQARIAELDEALVLASAHEVERAETGAARAELDEAQHRVAELEQALEAAHRGATEEGVARFELEQARERITDLEQALAEATRVRELEAPGVSEAPAAGSEQSDPGTLLLTAVRAADALRTAVRAEAQRTLKKARERATELERVAAQQQRAVDRARARAERIAADAEVMRQTLESANAERLDAERNAERARAELLQTEREADLVRERVRKEAEHTLASLQEQRQRVQSLLGDALAALDEDTVDTRGVLDDLASRLRPQAPDPA